MDELSIAKDILSKSLFVPKGMIGDDSDIASIKPLDSLAFEALALEIEQHLGHPFDVVALFGVKSVRDLAKVLEALR